MPIKQSLEIPMIRTITREDSASVIALAISSGMFPEEETGFLDTMLEDYFNARMHHGHVMLIREEDRPIGVAYYAPEITTDRTWNLLMIGVDRDFQAKGHGSALIQFVEDTLTSDGQRMLLVETSGLPAFEPARAFYAKCGYEQEARIRDYYGTGDDKIVFRKLLRSE
jgi:ribosomal protein S18 acetylase RimI-like enzyme